MNSDDVFDLFRSISVRKVGEIYSPYKPLLLLYSLSNCYVGKDRLFSYSEIDCALNKVVNSFFINLDYRNFHYAFGRLQNDNIWEISSNDALHLSDSGDLLKSELLDKNISGGFTEEIYQALKLDKDLIFSIVNYLLSKYFSNRVHSQLLSTFSFSIKDCYLHPVKSQEIKPTYNNKEIIYAINSGENHMAERQNGYIAYLNSLHNVTASGSNALAESQALNSYFTEIYQPFPLVDDLYKSLTEGKERVIILTGHAGDGKSTVALDVLKRLRQLPADKPLDCALNEREETSHANGKVTIVKDMSELTEQQRLEWLEQGFVESGSWLIVSNTGPLIHSLAGYVKKIGGRVDIESNILESLDQPYENGNLAQHVVTGFNKEMVILNMTRLDNVLLGARVLSNMVKHSAWDQCFGCEAEANCPLRLNRNALLSISETVEERVRWVYRRLTSYEQRLTLRQMVAHLALSLTGGLSCNAAFNLVKNTHETNKGEHDSLDLILFSEAFFGYRYGEPWRVADSLRAVSFIRRSVFGGPTAVDFERQLLVTGSIEGMHLPDSLNATKQRWRKRAVEAAGVRWRFAMRRMLYFFGQQSSPTTQHSDEFLSSFLQSPKLRDFNRWQNRGALKLENNEKRALLKRCLQVLLEIYSGFSASQFESDDSIYLTLRRPDHLVIQPTQLIVAKLSNQDFSLDYDTLRLLPKLVYKNGLAELPLTLPLLDYIHYRSIGQLGNELAPIHLAQMEWFRGELQNNSSTSNTGEIGLLQSGIDGKVKMHRFVIDEQTHELEKC
jgi:hypothetical protein